MGCDIHAHLEIEINGEWHYYSPVDLDRNYAMFCKMAGVRAYYDDAPAPISPPKGLPNDISFMANFLSNDFGVDGHSHSWLSFAELLELFEWFKEQDIKPWGYWNEPKESKWQELGVWLFGNTIGNLKKYPEDYPPDLEDIRLVFWFDN